MQTAGNLIFEPGIRQIPQFFRIAFQIVKMMPMNFVSAQ